MQNYKRGDDDTWKNVYCAIERDKKKIAINDGNWEA